MFEKEGGFGCVRCEERGGVIYAVKRLLKRNNSSESSELSLHTRSLTANTVYSATHDTVSIAHIIRLDATSTPNEMIMPFIEQDLRDVILQRRSMIPNPAPQDSLSFSVQITKDLLTALSHLSELNIVHRDVKPENILIHSNRAVLCDFGSAVESGTTVMAPMAGCSLCYCPVECLYGAKEASSKWDAWAAGMVFAETATLRSVLTPSDECSEMSVASAALGLVGWAERNDWASDLPFGFLVKPTPPDYPELGNAVADEVVKSMLNADPAKRTTAESALQRLSSF